MEILELYRRGKLVGRYALGQRGLEIGSGSSCDLVVDDPAVAAHHWLVMARNGTVLAYDVSRGRRGRAFGQPLARDADFGLGTDHVLRRATPAPPDRGPASAPLLDAATQELPRSAAAEGKLYLTIGSGTEARKVALGERCLQIGRAEDNDVVLSDRAVSERHARIEPAGRAIWVRDLGSRNGTFVDGVAVQNASVRPGSRVRLGRTDLHVIATGSSAGEAGPRLVAESSEMLQVLADVQRMAALPWPVLVIGESGTGKEGIAQSLHALGPRAERPFIAVNAGGLPRELIESELFGHERGAFTGANAAHRGVFEQAHGGTLFFDEIGELPLELQARLLRVLETSEIRRLGSERTIAVDVRLVCATHRDVRAMVSTGVFRQDLYYRIARLVLHVPALRARPDDIGVLARHFLEQISKEIGRRELRDDALGRLLAYDWPGNARELRNVLCAAAASSSAYIEPSDIERALADLSDGTGRSTPPSAAYRSALAQFGGNKSAAARALGIPRSTLRDRLGR